MLRLTENQQEKIAALGTRLERELTTKYIKVFYEPQFGEEALENVVKWVEQEDLEESQVMDEPKMEPDQEESHVMDEPKMEQHKIVEPDQDLVEMIATAISTHFKHINPKTILPSACADKTIVRATVETQDALHLLGQVISSAVAHSVAREHQVDHQLYKCMTCVNNDPY